MCWSQISLSTGAVTATISQCINDCDNVPKPVGYHWQSLAINTLSVNVQ